MDATERGSITGGRFFLRGAPPPARARRTLVWLGALALLLLVISPLFGENGLPAYVKLQRQRAELQRQVEQLDTMHADQQQQIEALQNDPAVLERAAREQYGMQRPGQQIYEVVDEVPADR